MSSLIILGVIALAITGGIGVATSVAFASRDKMSPKALPSAKRDALSLRVDDVVVHLSTTWVVSGRIRCDDAGTTWFLYRLDDGGASAWLRARFSDTLKLELVEEAGERPSSGQPPPSLSHGGIDYELESWSQVRLQHQGQTERSGGRMEFFEYRAPGQKVLFKEIQQGVERTSVGRRIEAHHLEFLPGDDISKEV